ncbi:hypothetical protein C3489_21390 [Streptomyces sp. Ru71]|uniref:hypothetical protein n=1 Tax=Streptomyces sp. Ru71 TaxID=2080746 RepID=UPI000CDD0E43|nr:hypothetical protein [Streptomyces sp. Ru71]POX50832.1 hypothetical protein C3489_21390 [Streptomyces sp. Ru71]
MNTPSRTTNRWVLALLVPAEFVPGILAALILGTVGTDQILRSLGVISRASSDPSLLLGVLLVSVALAPFAIAAITAAYQRRRGGSWERALKACANAALVSGLLAVLVALPVSITVA